MLKYQDDEIFSNTALVIDAYQQKIDNVFFGRRHWQTRI